MLDELARMTLLKVRTKEQATQADRDLAHLLMRAAFDNDGAVEIERGLGPLYLEQAFVMRRTPELRQRILAELAGEN